MEIREMEVWDVDQVMEIDRRSFKTPWSKKSMMDELTRNPFATYLVITRGEEILGYGGFWLLVDEGHITNIAVKEEERGKGFGKILMYAMLDHCRSCGGKHMTLEVRRSNHVAKKLYEGYGFREKGVRREYYEDKEDALIYWKDL